MKVYLSAAGDMLCGRCAASRGPDEPGTDEVCMEVEFLRGVEQNCDECRVALLPRQVDSDPRPS